VATMTDHEYFVAYYTAEFFAHRLPAGYYPRPAAPEPRPAAPEPRPAAPEPRASRHGTTSKTATAAHHGTSPSTPAHTVRGRRG
jgi:hypothetical protein